MNTMIAFEKWAEPVLEKYQKMLLLDDHILTFQYKKLNKDTIMEHDCNYPYKVMCIWYGDYALEMWKLKGYKELTGVIIHELAHAIVFPLAETAEARFTNRETITNETERLTDHIANIITKYEHRKTKRA